MDLIKKLPLKKTWCVIVNKKTGEIGQGYSLLQGPYATVADYIQRAVDKKATFGTITPVWYQYGSSPYEGPCASDFEALDHIPVYRGDLEFYRLYNGTSSVSVRFKTRTGHELHLRGAYADKFFEYVGSGKITMKPDGFYDVNFTFSKGGEKMYIDLYGYDE